MKQRLCQKCQRPLSYYNIGETCFRHYDYYTDWKVRQLRYNQHALTWPWDAGLEYELQRPQDAILNDRAVSFETHWHQGPRR